MDPTPPATTSAPATTSDSFDLLGDFASAPAPAAAKEDDTSPPPDITTLAYDALQVLPLAGNPAAVFTKADFKVGVARVREPEGKREEKRQRGCCSQ